MHNCLLMFLIILSFGNGFINCTAAQQRAAQLLELAQSNAQVCATRGGLDFFGISLLQELEVVVKLQAHPSKHIPCWTSPWDLGLNRFSKKRRFLSWTGQE